MDVVFKVWLNYFDESGRKHSDTYASKTLDLPAIPTIGMEIEDSAWSQALTVKNICMSLDGGIVSVYLGALELNSQEHLQACIQQHQACAWEIYIASA